MNQEIFDQTTHYKQEKANFSPRAVRLTIFDGTSEPTEYNLADFDKTVITFGRGDGNDIQLRSSYVSRTHGQIQLSREQCVVEDLGSSNGLIFDGEYVHSRVIKDGDTIRIDDGVETTSAGVLMVFTWHDSDPDWKTFDIASQKETTIGRDSSCDIILDHVSVSKFHGKIIASDKHYFLVDNNSTNGIIINGKKVEGKIRLQEKDVILITNSKLIFGSGKISYCCYKSGISVESFNLYMQVKERDKNSKIPLKKRDKIICNNVSLHIKPGELVTIVGGSGAGKSTVMNCLSGYNQPTGGGVIVNGVDLYENFDALKTVIGYVPQSDIVYDNLTVFDMLVYAAKLRLPKDITASERTRCINSVIDKVELTANKDTLIKRLSGGQRKRASIAVELISDPNLFFLDEPASGLDPGTERNLMLTLKKMTAEGKTIIFVTHSTLNLHLCDKIVFMGKGGNLCFYGSLDESLAFFGVDDIVDVYNLISDDSEYWRDKYSNEVKSGISNAAASAAIKKTSNRGLLVESAILYKRNMHITMNDRIRLMLILMLAPLLALLISFVADGSPFYDFVITQSLLFSLSCATFFVGILNSVQEICKERNIIKREYMAGLRLDSYIIAKMSMMATICAIQSILMVSVFALVVGLPTYSIFGSAYLEILAATFLTALSASAMGIFVSSLFKNADRAMAVSPLLLMPQLLFSGIIFELYGVSEILSYAVICRWSMQSYGSTSNLNAMYSFTTGGFQIATEYSTLYTHSSMNLLSTWGILCAFILLFSILAGCVLRSIKKERG